MRRDEVSSALGLMHAIGERAGLVLLTKLKHRDARHGYASQALDRGWSRAVLVHHLEARTVERKGKALTNFAERLPKPLSDLARESLEDPYRFDFLGIGDEASDLELEGALVQQMGMRGRLFDLDPQRPRPCLTLPGSDRSKAR